MSALNVVVEDRAVHFLTDGAAGFHGRFVWPVAKAYPLPHLNLVIAGRGRAADIRRIVDRVQREYRTFDEILAAAREGSFLAALRRVRLAMPWRYRCQLIVGGISEATGRASAFCFLTAASGNLPRWAAIDIPQYFLAPEDGQVRPDEFMALHRSLGLGAAFYRLIGQQRAQSDGRFIVGGFGQVTTIRREVERDLPARTIVRSQIIRRWAEKEFARIDPEAPEIDP